MARINLSPKEIFEREFKPVFRGYDKDEVDEFLDEIIKDYEVFELQLQALRKENEQLRAELKSGKTDNQPTAYKVADFNEQAIQSSDVDRFSSAVVSNYDLLKRISRLEKEVFGKQIVE